MALFQILEKPKTTNEITEDDSEIIIEKFYWVAAIFLPLWLMSKNLWLELVFWLAFTIVLGAISAIIGTEVTAWLYILGAVWFGFEAPNILARSLKRRGYISQGDMVSPNYEQAQVAWIKHRLG